VQLATTANIASPLGHRLDQWCEYVHGRACPREEPTTATLFFDVDTAVDDLLLEIDAITNISEYLVELESRCSTRDDVALAMAKRARDLVLVLRGARSATSGGDA
jgi:hypothetical protein